MTLSRDVSDRLLTADEKLNNVDAERYHLDLSEIIDEATKIASLLDTSSAGTASELLAELSGSVAHLQSHWERLARDTGWSAVYGEMIKTYRSVNDDRKRWWRRFRRAV